jgi:hypothetical protein
VTLEKRIVDRKFTYTTFLLSGWLRGKRVTRQFVPRDEALGEKLLQDGIHTMSSDHARPVRPAGSISGEAIRVSGQAMWFPGVNGY